MSNIQEQHLINSHNDTSVTREPLLSLVVPVFNEAQVIETFYMRTYEVLVSLNTMRYEIVFVDDGSEDDSHQKLIHIANKNPNVTIIRFSRNFGHQMAITAGLDHAKGDAVVIIDADLQDPPEVIPRLTDKWQEGYDVVYAVRDKRAGESALKLITASIFYRLLKRLSKIEIPQNVGDFRLMSRRVVQHFKDLRERDRFVRGLVSWIGFRQAGVSYVRDQRYAGETKYPYRKMIRFAFDGITSFSTVPLKVATWLGYLSSFLAFLYACSVFVQKYALSTDITVKGWPTIIISVLFLGGVQLICLGIVGEYIGRIYNEIKRRPLYVIADIYQDNFDARPHRLTTLGTSQQ